MDDIERDQIRVMYGDGLANAKGPATHYGYVRNDLERLKRENAMLRDFIDGLNAPTR